MKLRDIFDIMIEKDISDTFVRAYSPLRGKILLEVSTINDYVFSIADINKIISGLLNNRQKEALEKHRSVDLAISYKDRWRFRVAVFYQRNTVSIVIRKVDLNIASFEELNLPKVALERFSNEKQGLILLTGVTGSGKSTTIATMMKYINENLSRHILTIEEPIEFTFNDEKSIINQREVGVDVYSYPDALRQFTLHAPDIIYIGNIRDKRTCEAALTAAETGVLLLSTMHTIDARSTVERIVSFFPPQQHNLIFMQMAALLKGVISLRLLPRIDVAGLIPAYEVMTLSPTISDLIRENKLWEIPNYITTGAIHGMKSFNQCLFDLVKSKKISTQAALANSNSKEDLSLMFRKTGLL